MSDWKLLRQYVDDNCQASFGRLIDRHMKLVYWTCRRELRDAQLAEDASQEVFLHLARKAVWLRSDVSVAGWLFNTARFVSKNMLRREATRRRVEEHIVSNAQHSMSYEQDWPTIEPRMNEALSALNASDRDAVLLRYFEGRSLQELAREIGTSEETARKRVWRAVDRLRRFLNRREVDITSTALVMLLSEQSCRTSMPDSHCAMLQAIQHTLLVQPAVSATYPDHAVVRNGVHLVMEAVKRKVAIAAVAVVLLAGGSFIAVSTWNSSMANTLSGSVQMPAAWRGDPAFNAIDKAYAIAAEPANVGDMGCVAGYAAPGCVVQVEGGNTLESSLATDISKHLFQSLPRELDTVKVSESVESMNHSPGGDVVAVVRCKIEGVTCMDEVLYGAQRVKRGTRITLDPTFQDVWQQRSGQWLNTKRTWLAPSNKALSLYPLEDAPGAYRPRP